MKPKSKVIKRKGAEVSTEIEKIYQVNKSNQHYRVTYRDKDGKVIFIQELRITKC